MSWGLTINTFSHAACITEGANRLALGCPKIRSAIKFHTTRACDRTRYYIGPKDTHELILLSSLFYVSTMCSAFPLVCTQEKLTKKKVKMIIALVNEVGARTIFSISGDFCAKIVFFSLFFFLLQTHEQAENWPKKGKIYDIDLSPSRKTNQQVTSLFSCSLSLRSKSQSFCTGTKSVFFKLQMQIQEK